MRSAAFFLCFVVAGCSDTFTERYPTVEAAQNDGIFERGWLPEVLPSSAHSLRVSGDIDINFADGEFGVRSADFEAFISTLESDSGASSIPERFLGDIQALKDRGYTAREYARDNYTWLFLCSKENGHCEYRGWPER
jgi:hypothetical protein